MSTEDKMNRPFQSLAVAVICQALVDLGDPAEDQVGAERFLVRDMWQPGSFPVLAVLPELETRRDDMRTLVIAIKAGEARFTWTQLLRLVMGRRNQSEEVDDEAEGGVS